MKKNTRIDQICDVKRGASPRPIGDKRYFSEEGRGWVRISDVTNSGKYLRNASQYLSKLGESKSVSVDPGDLIMSICATIGRPIIIDIPACIHDGFVVFRNISKDVDVEYLYYALSKNEIKFRNMKQVGTQGNLNTGLVGRTSIYLPSKEEQVAIVKLLSTVDSAIEKADAIIGKTEKIRRGFIHTFLFEKSSLKSKWSIERINNILLDEKGAVKVGPFGSQLKKSEMVPAGHKVYGQENVMAQDFNIGEKYISSEKFTQMKGFIIKPGDVLITMMGSVGFSTVAPEDIKKGIMDSHLMRMSVDCSKCLPEFISKLLNDSIEVKQQIKRMSQGAIMSGLNSKIVKALKVPIPTVKVQKKFLEHITLIDDKLEKESCRKYKLERIKQGLMNDLLTGEKLIKAD